MISTGHLEVERTENTGRPRTVDSTKPSWGFMMKTTKSRRSIQRRAPSNHTPIVASTPWRQRSTALHSSSIICTLQSTKFERGPIETSWISRRRGFFSDTMSLFCEMSRETRWHALSKRLISCWGVQGAWPMTHLSVVSCPTGGRGRCLGRTVGHLSTPGYRDTLPRVRYFAAGLSYCSYRYMYVP